MDSSGKYGGWEFDVLISIAHNPSKNEKAQLDDTLEMLPYWPLCHKRRLISWRADLGNNEQLFRKVWPDQVSPQSLARPRGPERQNVSEYCRGTGRSDIFSALFDASDVNPGARCHALLVNEQVNEDV